MSLIVWKNGKAYHAVEGYEIKTAPPKYQDVDIDWYDYGDMYDEAGDGYTYFYEVFGVDEDGNEYTGVAPMVCGEIDYSEVEDIERVKNV